MEPDINVFSTLIDLFGLLIKAGGEVVDAFVNLLGRIWEFIKVVAKVINEYPN